MQLKKAPRVGFPLPGVRVRVEGGAWGYRSPPHCTPQLSFGRNLQSGSVLEAVNFFRSHCKQPKLWQGQCWAAGREEKEKGVALAGGGRFEGLLSVPPTVGTGWRSRYLNPGADTCSKQSRAGAGEEV